MENVSHDPECGVDGGSEFSDGNREREEASVLLKRREEKKKGSVTSLCCFRCP